MPNRRFEMYQYRHILVRMRMGDSNRAIADSGIAGRNKVKAIKRIASNMAGLNRIASYLMTHNWPLSLARDHPTQRQRHLLHLMLIK